MSLYENESAHYMKAVAAAITAGNELMVTQECGDCDTSVGQSGWIGSYHTCASYKGRTIVVIGCEGYHHIDPAAVGMPVGNWIGVEGVNIPNNG